MEFVETIGNTKKFTTNAVSHLDSAAKCMLCHKQKTCSFSDGNHRKPIEQAFSSTRNAIVPLMSVPGMYGRMENALEH
jgi:hypothetical protein